MGHALALLLAASAAAAEPDWARRARAAMVIPVGERGQKLVLARKTEKGMVRQPILDVVFVPMTGESQRRRR